MVVQAIRSGRGGGDGLANGLRRKVKNITTRPCLSVLMQLEGRQTNWTEDYDYEIS